MPAALIIAVHALRIFSVSNGDHTISDVGVIQCRGYFVTAFAFSVWNEKLPFRSEHAKAIAALMVLKLCLSTVQIMVSVRLFPIRWSSHVSRHGHPADTCLRPAGRGPRISTGMMPMTSPLLTAILIESEAGSELYVVWNPVSCALLCALNEEN